MTDFAFLHGGGQGGWVWDETIAALAAQSGGRARCIALDMPGCGAKRGRDTADIAFDAIAQELVEDVAAAGLSDVVLVGHSQAGLLMPQMAQLAPSMFRRLVFVACAAPLPGHSMIDQMGMGLHGSSADQVGWPVDPLTASLEDRLRIMFCSEMDPVDADAFLARLGADLWPQVCYEHADWRRDHLAPMAVSYVVCLKDRALPPEWQLRFAERLHAQRIARIDAGHLAMVTRPHGLAEILLAEAEA